MRELLHLTAADARRVPWKNGRGVTEELAIWPRDASLLRGDFDWRIARAGVDAAGPFSRFPGFDRVLVVVGGDGLLLRHGAAPPVSVRPLQPHAFSGDERTEGEPLGGPVTDVNVLARRGRVAADVAALRIAGRRAEPLRAGHVVLHVLEGAAEARVSGGGAVRLAARESLWLRDAGSETLVIESAACLALLVRIGNAET